MKHAMPVLVAFLLLATSAIYAEPVPSGPYTGTPEGTSSGDVLWSQLDEPSGSAWTDQAFEATYAAYDSWGADDFAVHTIEWELESLFTPGSLLVSGGPLFVNIAFYADAGGVPGAVVANCDFPANTNFTVTEFGNLTIDVEGCHLSCSDGGAFWFSQQVRMDWDPFGQHYWATRSTQSEYGSYPGVWKNPGNGFGLGCVDWQPANAVCGMTGEDWLFELSGWGSPYHCGGGGGQIPAIGPFGVVVLILALGGGSAYVLRRRR